MQEPGTRQKVRVTEWKLISVDEADPRPALIALLPDLRRYARFLARHVTEADDLVQDAIVRALSALPQYRAGSNLRAWLFTILRNTFYEQSRRRRTELAILAQHPTEDAGSAPAQQGLIDLDDLHRTLFALPPLLREALVLVGAHEMSYEEAAFICAVPAGTMKARVSRARGQLARLMAPTETSLVKETAPCAPLALP